MSESRPIPTRGRRLLILAALVLGFVSATIVLLWPLRRVDVLEPLVDTTAEPIVQAAPNQRETALVAQLDRLRPRHAYAVVDSFANRFTIYRDGQILQQSRCSTGSGTVLRDPRTGRLWVFDTPVGEHRITRKVRDPVWIRPDWSFVEEGREPPPGLSGRVDDLSLGEYGLYLGDGYIIHGTLFQTLLGQSATHGCIRLGNEDLEHAFETLAVGARVFVY